MTSGRQRRGGWGCQGRDEKTDRNKEGGRGDKQSCGDATDFFFKKEEKKKGRKKVVLRAGVSKESSKALERHWSQRNFYICVHIHVTGEVFQSDKAA